MNLKERGITVGDLLIILIAILTSALLVKTFNKDNKSTLNSGIRDKLAYENNHFIKSQLSTLFI